MAWTDIDMPCGWSPDPSCCPQWEDASPELQERASRLAAFVLWAKSGRQFGRCSRTIRPCRKPCDSNLISGRGAWGVHGWQPEIHGGRWFNVRCGCPTDSCSCGKICEVELPGVMPEPEAVIVDGKFLPSSAYRVDNGRWLVRQDGECWPDCQDMSLPPSRVGTWQVRFTSGIPVTSEINFLTGILACEFVKACLPGVREGECRLPSNVRRIARQNVTIEFSDTSQLVAGAGVGIPEVDLWLTSVNPNNLPRTPMVMSPDLKTYREQSWP